MNKRKIILNLCTSLDAYIEGPNGEIDWCFTDQDYSMTEFLEGIDTIFIGRKSYEQLIQEMPNAFSDKNMVVFSKTLKGNNATRKIIHSDVRNEVHKILNQSGKNIWLFGGANLVTTFMNLKLVDELMLSIHPLLLGKGKPLFIDLIGRCKLELLDNKTFSSGLVQLLYNVNGNER